MIKINLLGEQKKSDPYKLLWLYGFAASLVVSLIIFYSMKTSIAGEIEDLTEEKSSLEMQLAVLEKKTAVVKELEKKKKSLQRKLTVIAGLKKSKIGPVRVLDDLNQAIPSKIWLREVKEQSGRYRIRGRALTNQDIALFMKNIDSSEYFSDVDLVESRQVFYAKKTGTVMPRQSINAYQTSSDKNVDGRRTKKVSPEGGRKKKVVKQKASFDDKYIRIQEFVIASKVSYSGELEVKGGGKKEAKTKGKKKE